MLSGVSLKLSLPSLPCSLACRALLLMCRAPERCLRKKGNCLAGNKLSGRCCGYHPVWFGFSCSSSDSGSQKSHLGCILFDYNCTCGISEGISDQRFENRLRIKGTVFQPYQECILVPAFSASHLFSSVPGNEKLNSIESGGIERVKIIL